MEVNKIMITMIINKYLYNKMINFLKFGNFMQIVGCWNFKYVLSFSFNGKYT